MAKSQETRIACHLSPLKIREVIDAVVEDLVRRNSKYRVEKDTSNSVALRVGVGWLSWGEDVTLTVENASIHIISKCVVPTQIIDWGKNRKNVELVATTVHRAITRLSQT